MSESIKLDELALTRDKYLSGNRENVLRHALSTCQFNEVLATSDDYTNRDFSFSIDIKTLPVSNQKQSGRCWIFSASTILREIIAKKLNITSQFEISQNYISYFDKLEKYNYYMEGVINLLLQNESKDSRKMQFLLSGVGDGGQWDMYVALVKKYGVVPKSAFPETLQSNTTRLSTQFCNGILRQFALVARRNVKSGKDRLEEIKKIFMEKIYYVLTSSFGLPPEKFDFSYRDKDNYFHVEKDLTPTEFFNKYVGDEIDEYVSIINAPTDDKEYYQTYNVELVGNVVGAKPITHLNLPFERMEELIINQLKDNEIVWFGSDVSYYGNRSEGVWDTKSYDYVSAFDIDLRFAKSDMLDYYHSAMNHAMVITGVNLVDDKPNRWKIENSWGKENGKDGYYIMGEEFFNDFVYQAAIKKKYLNEKEISALSKKPVLLAPWDPFGTLAD